MSDYGTIPGAPEPPAMFPLSEADEETVRKAIPAFIERQSSKVPLEFIRIIVLYPQELCALSIEDNDQKPDFLVSTTVFQEVDFRVTKDEEGHYIATDQFGRVVKT